MSGFFKRHKLLVSYLVILFIPIFSSFISILPGGELLLGVYSAIFLLTSTILIFLFIPILIIDLIYASKKKKKEQAFQLKHTEQAERKLSQQQVAKRLEPKRKVAKKSTAQPSDSGQDKSIFEKAFEQTYCPKCGAAVNGTVCEDCGEIIG
jgi:hypothetical protein